MAKSTYRRGGQNVDVADGGTGADSAAAARAALGAGTSDFDSAAHAGVDHSGIPGVGGGVTESVTNSPGSGNDIVRAIPGGTLGADNESLEFVLWGTAASGDTATITFGALTILTFSPDAAEPFCVRGTILRTGASAQEITASYIPDGTGASNQAVTQNTTGALDLTSAQNLSAADGAGGITFTALIVRKWSA